MATTEIQLFSAGGFTLSPETFAPNGVRGADKVAQRFAYALFTPTGSIPGRPNDGCNFIELAALFRSEFDMFSTFAATEPAASATVRAAEDDTDPTSERLGSARLAGVTISGDGITLSMSITALDGSTPINALDFTLEL